MAVPNANVLACIPDPIVKIVINILITLKINAKVNKFYLFLVNNPCSSNPCGFNSICNLNGCGFTCVTCKKKKKLIKFVTLFKLEYISISFIVATTTVSTTVSTQSPCPICYNGGYCNYVNNNPVCNCPCFYSGPYCQTCKKIPRKLR